MNTSDLLEDRVVADLAIRQRHWGTALPRLLRLARDGKQLEAARQAVQIAEQMSDWVGSLEAARLWVGLEPAEETAQAMVLLGLLRSNQVDQATLQLRVLWHVSQKDHPAGHFMELLLQIHEKLSREANVSILEVLTKARAEHSLPENMQLEMRLAQAKILESMGKKDQARETFEQIWQAFHDSPLAAEQYGLMLLRQEGPGEALRFFIEQSKRFEQEPSLALHTGQILYAWGRLQQARMYAERALALAPDSDSARYLLASVFYAQKSLDKAAHHFLLFLEKRKQSDDALFYLGEIYRQQKRPELAVLFYDSVNAGKHLKDARIQAARLLADQDRLPEALARLRSNEVRNLRQQVDMAKAAADLLSQGEQGQELLQTLREEWHQKPTDPFLAFLALLTTPDEGLDNVIERMVSQIPDASRKEWTLVLGSVLFELNKHAAAIRAWNHLLKEDANNPQALYAKAISLAQLHRYEEAINSLNQVLHIQPDNADAMNALGYIMTLKGINLRQAEQWIRQALEQKPESPEVLDSLGWVLFKQGDLPNARKQLEKAWKLDKNPEIGAHLGEVLWHLGDRNGARKVWQQALQQDSENELLLTTIRRYQKQDDQ